MGKFLSEAVLGSMGIYGTQLKKRPVKSAMKVKRTGNQSLVACPFNQRGVINLMYPNWSAINAASTRMASR